MVDQSTSETTSCDRRRAPDAPGAPTPTQGVAPRQVVRQTLYAVISGMVLVVLFLILIRLAPGIGVLAYFPTVFGLEVLEYVGMNTLHGSPEGWPVPTNLGLVIAGGAWWIVFTLPTWVFFRARQKCSKSARNAI